jgi:hypothetical protein
VDPVAAFLDARPHYDPAHVREIVTACEIEGIPFCTGCADFHHPDEPHTED